MLEKAPWFTDARFGMFIHWGLYALPARHEWVKNHEETSNEDYQKYFDHFDPDLYDPREWAQAAKNAGMKYMVLTTKHHEGFCLWDSALTDYKVTNTPIGRDLLREYVDAVREAGLKVGFYHSLIDWHHPDFTIDGVHPQRNHPDRDKLDEGKDLGRYREYLHGQVRELLTDYGQIDYLFFDFSYKNKNPDGIAEGKGAEEWGSEELLAMVRELQPGIVVNDRLEIPGDFVTPEQYQPSGPLTNDDGTPLAWEACQTLNGSWGYYRDNYNYKSVPMLLGMLIDGVSKDGNLLLNVGPTGRGYIDGVDVKTLEGIGEWMRLHGRSIYGAGASEFTPPQDVRYTQRGDRLYVHVLAWPFGHLHLPDLDGKVEYAQLLNDASEIKFRGAKPGQEAVNTTPGSQPAGTLTLDLPVRAPEVAVPVIELFLKE